MREIRFRGWHVSAKKMFSADEMATDQLTLLTTGSFINVHGGLTQLSTIFDRHKFIPLQFTGLLDKNGKEIYEGDIVRWDDGSNGAYWRVAECFYDTDEAIFSYRIVNAINCNVKIGYVFGGAFMYRNGKELEVIGDKFSNPELLNP